MCSSIAGLSFIFPNPVQNNRVSGTYQSHEAELPLGDIFLFVVEEALRVGAGSWSKAGTSLFLPDFLDLKGVNYFKG